MPKGRKPEPGTLEAREFVRDGWLSQLLADCDLTNAGAARIVKAVNFGLGIKPTIDELIKEATVKEG